MRTWMPRAGLTGSRAAASSDPSCVDCPRRPAAGRTPRAVVWLDPVRLSVRRRFRQVVHSHGACTGRLSGRRAGRQRRRGARRGVVAMAHRGARAVVRRRVAALHAQRRQRRRPPARWRGALGSAAPHWLRSARAGLRARAVCPHDLSESNAERCTGSRQHPENSHCVGWRHVDECGHSGRL